MHKLNIFAHILWRTPFLHKTLVSQNKPSCTLFLMQLNKVLYFCYVVSRRRRHHRGLRLSRVSIMYLVAYLFVVCNHFYHKRIHHQRQQTLHLIQPNAAQFILPLCPLFFVVLLQTSSNCCCIFFLTQVIQKKLQRRRGWERAFFYSYKYISIYHHQ